MKSYKKFILASLASAAILSAYSMEVQAATDTSVIEPASEIDQTQETAVAEPEVLNEVAEVTEPTAQSGEDSLENTEAADITEATVQTDDEYIENKEVAPVTEAIAQTDEDNLENTTVADVTTQTYADNLERANDSAYLEENLTANDGGQYDAQGNLIGLTIGGETAPVTQEKPEVLPVPVNDTPNRITTNLSETPATSMLFQWHTTNPDPDARLYVWEDTQDQNDAVAYTPETVTIDDAFHIQTTPEGYYVYAILEDFNSSDSNPFRAVDGSDTPIGYYTDEVFSADNIQWLDKGYDNWSIALPYEAFEETAYRVEATHLKPNTTYKYLMGNPETGQVSEISTFKTASTTNDPFSFIHYTDTQAAFSSDNQRPEWAYSKDALESAIAVAPDSAFAIHTGDIVNDQWNDTEWLKTLEALETVNQAMPHMYVTGNHDRENFLTHINTPNAMDDMESGVAYSLDYNGVHFVVLNTEHDRDRAEGEEEKAILDSQLQWLRDDLTQARAERDAGHINWIIAAYHRPLFSSSYHSLEDESVQLVRDELMQILDEYDVDFVLNGHDHNLTVTQPLLHDTNAFGNARVDGSEVVTENGVTTYYNPEGTVFFIPNTAGTKTYEAIYNNKTMDWILEHEDIDVTYADLFDHTVTAEDLEYFRTLLLTEEQPFRSSYYSDGHSNAREGNIQHYAVVDVTPETITYKLYEVVGENLEIEGGRETNLVHTYVITKNAPESEVEDTEMDDVDEERPEQEVETPETDDVEEEQAEAEVEDRDNDDISVPTGGEQVRVTPIGSSIQSSSEFESIDSTDADTDAIEDKEIVDIEDAEVSSASALPQTGSAPTDIFSLIGLFLSGTGLTLLKRKDD